MLALGYAHLPARMAPPQPARLADVVSAGHSTLADTDSLSEHCYRHQRQSAHWHRRARSRTASFKDRTTQYRVARPCEPAGGVKCHRMQQYAYARTCVCACVCASVCGYVHMRRYMVLTCHHLLYECVAPLLGVGAKLGTDMALHHVVMMTSLVITHCFGFQRFMIMGQVSVCACTVTYCVRTCAFVSTHKHTRSAWRQTHACSHMCACVRACVYVCVCVTDPILHSGSVEVRGQGHACCCTATGACTDVTACA